MIARISHEELWRDLRIFYIKNFPDSLEPLEGCFEGELVGAVTKNELKAIYAQIAGAEIFVVSDGQLDLTEMGPRRADA
jgi:hypothetical protein